MERAVMGIFDFFTGKSSAGNVNSDNYGRFLECNKPLYFSNIFKEATDLFKAEKYSESFMKFLDYISNPPSQNVSYEKKGNDIEFTIIHGSAKITGVFNSEGVYATSEIGQYSEVATA
ncbi:MAG TPA: hypothetical protein PKV35_10530, partial [bacterium]|nr:hypothetical protein [bacterium]